MTLRLNNRKLGREPSLNIFRRVVSVLNQDFGNVFTRPDDPKPATAAQIRYVLLLMKRKASGVAVPPAMLDPKNYPSLIKFRKTGTAQTQIVLYSSGGARMETRTTVAGV